MTAPIRSVVHALEGVRSMARSTSQTFEEISLSLQGLATTLDGVLSSPILNKFRS